MWIDRKWEGKIEAFENNQNGGLHITWLSAWTWARSSFQLQKEKPRDFRAGCLILIAFSLPITYLYFNLYSKINTFFLFLFNLIIILYFYSSHCRGDKMNLFYKINYFFFCRNKIKSLSFKFCKF